MRGILRPKASLLILLLCFAYTSILMAQTLPVAVNDSLYPVIPFDPGADPVELNLLVNDYDPLGEPLELAEVQKIGKPTYTFTLTDSAVVFNGAAIFPMGLAEQVFRYRVRRISDTTALSNWAFLYMNASQDPAFAVARNDTVRSIPGYPVDVNVLLNDFHPAGDNIYITANMGGVILNDSMIRVSVANPYQASSKDFFYVISDTNVPWVNFDAGIIHLQLEHRDYYDSLDVNNINARFNCFGNHFWDLDSRNQFIVPQSGSASSIWSSAFWIGGLDPGETLHQAGERYRQVGMDYWAGPVSDVYDSAYDIRWFHIWKLNRSDIDYHKANWWTAGYEPLPDIASWPGNGEAELGQAARIAPFDDLNGNGLYEPMQGDAPQIKGDQALFFVFNDARKAHGESQGIPLGIEVRAMAYAFDAPDDSALWNTVFLHYDIVNRSDTAYHDMYLGSFTDFALGYDWDDRVESDVERGMYFVYNGVEEDGIQGDPLSYGPHPPAQGVQFLGGAYLDPDGIDNPRYDNNGNQLVDYSINGLGFGDGIVDNERLGMTHFIYFNGGGGSWPSDPYEAHEYYNYMQSVWRDGTPLQYGGYGHPSAGSVGPDCNFMWPRDTDPWNWGTAEVLPNGGYNQNGLYWSAEETGMNPTNVRGLGGSGPFSLEPGQTQSLDLAFTWARDYDGTAWGSALLLKQRAESIKYKFTDTSFFSRTHPVLAEAGIRIYPNPSRHSVAVSWSTSQPSVSIDIISYEGRAILHHAVKNCQETVLDIRDFPPGLYFIRIISGGAARTFKFVKN